MLRGACLRKLILLDYGRVIHKLILVVFDLRVVTTILADSFSTPLEGRGDRGGGTRGLQFAGAGLFLGVAEMLAVADYQ